MVCVHENTLDDHHTGDVICVDCGIILDKILLFDKCLIQEIYPNISKFEDFRELRSICEKLVCSPAVTTRIIEKYTFLKHASSISDSFLFAAAIFSTLNQEISHKSIKEICYYANITPKRFWKVIKPLKLDYSFEATNMTRCLLQTYKFNHREIEEINIFVEKLKSTNFSPKTIIAVACYLHLKKKKGKTSVSKVAKKLNCSPMSIYRCLNKLRKECFITAVSDCSMV